MKKLVYAGILVLCLAACREEAEIFIPEIIPVAPPDSGGIIGFYLLNEGNMGSNKATLDYFDYTTSNYHRNI
jgi:hypothetical protein